jgi:glycosyltransferase involved in cell wall biosynthesis
MIIFCEPQCYGFEHAGVNAALIQVAMTAYPEDRAILMAERTHLEHIKKMLEMELSKKIEFVEMQIAPRRASNIKRFFSEHKVYGSALSYAKKNHSQKVVFLSITSPGLLWLKLKLAFFSGVNAVAVMHGILETIEEWSAILKYEIIFWFRFTLMMGNYERIRYLVFGSFIKQALSKRFPSMSFYTKSMDLPYRFKAPVLHEPFHNRTVKFGALGVGSRSKGTDVFFEVADKMVSLQTEYKAEFMLIGPLMDKSLRIPAGVRVLSRDGNPLKDEEYDRAAGEIDYSVFCHDPSHYRYSSSAAFFDALSFGKPVIALRNPLFEYYFNLFGDIGYLCGTREDMMRIINEILDSPSVELYSQQRTNILKGREYLNLEHSAAQFREIW